MSQLTPEDLMFLEWIHLPQNDAYWVKDENGEKVMLREGWDMAQAKYNQIKELAGDKLKELANNKTIFYSEEDR